MAKRVAAASQLEMAISKAYKGASSEEEVEYVRAYEENTPEDEKSLDGFSEYMSLFEKYED